MGRGYDLQFASESNRRCETIIFGIGLTRDRPVIHALDILGMLNDIECSVEGLARPLTLGLTQQ